MATNQPARGGAAESMSEFVKRWNREQAARNQAKAASHQAYGDALRAKLDLDFPTPGDVVAHGANADGGIAQTRYKSLQPNFFETPAAQIGHPSPAESFIPVWGSGREALADLADGKPVRAALNGLLAGVDAVGVGMAEKFVGKGGAYAVKGAIGEPAKKAEWRFVRGQMRASNLLEKGREGHHWLIAQRHDWVPPVVRNHPLNIHPMEPITHGRLRNSYLGLPRFGLFGRYWRGTPHGSKVATVSAAGHVASAAVNAEADHK